MTTMTNERIASCCADARLALCEVVQLLGPRLVAGRTAPLDVRALRYEVTGTEARVFDGERLLARVAADPHDRLTFGTVIFAVGDDDEA